MNIYKNNKKNYFSNLYSCSRIIIYFFIILNAYSSEIEIHESTHELYNEVYNILTIHYTFFLKKYYLLDENFLNRLLRKETVNEKNEIILVKKEAHNFRMILEILKAILKKTTINSNTLVNTEKLEKFINIINREIESNNNIFQAFKKAIYVITGNENRYNSLNSINMASINFHPEIFNDISLLTIFWVLWSYEKFSNILNTRQIAGERQIQNEEFFVYSYPFYIHSLNKTFKEIKIDQTLIKYFIPLLITNEGASYLINNEKYSKAINENMAYHLIANQKIKLMELLLDEKNKDYFNRINSLMKKIAEISQELILLKQGKASPNNWLFNLFDVPELSIQDYFRQYIPEKIFNVGSGIHSNKGTYTIHSGVKFYESALGSTAYKIWRHLNQESSEKERNEIYNPFFTNMITKSFFPYAELWPFSTSYNKEKLEENFQYIVRITKGKKTIADCYWENQQIYTFQDRIQQYQNMPGIGGKILNAIPAASFIVGGFTHLMLTAAAIRTQYFSIKSLLSQYKGIKNHYKYFFCLKKLIFYSKRLLNELIKLYQENNINSDFLLPEIIQMKKILNNKKESGLLNKILSWSNKNINIVMRSIYNFFFPGSMAHFYFKELYESIEIDTLNNFIGSIDITLAKLKLLELKKEHHSITFNIPILLNPKDNTTAILKIKNMWFPSLRGAPIKNSVMLEKDEKNMMLVSPVAGGKTVLLSTILTQLYLANMGIAAADELEYTYFTNIVDHMRHDYDIGSGTSQHLAERKSMQAVKNIAANQKDTEKSIIIIDEIYKGTIPQLAVKEAFLDLPPILKKNNIITIITTHFPEITKITENKELSIKLYYLLVDHIGGVFNRTHKLFKDDENNWWLRDSELGLKYQLSHDTE
jgi:hypothetical protein